MENELMSFKTWLLENHLGEDTRIGDLAEDVKQDEEFPVTDEFEDLYYYIEYKPGSCQDAAIALMAAYVGWYDYVQEHLLR